MWMVKNDHAAFLGDHPGRMSWTKLQQLGGGRMPKTVQMDVGWPRKIGVFLILRLVGVMKNLQPQTGPGQNSFFSFFYHFGYHYIHHFFIIYFIIFIFLSFQVSISCFSLAPGFGLRSARHRLSRVALRKAAGSNQCVNGDGSFRRRFCLSLRHL